MLCVRPATVVLVAAALLSGCGSDSRDLTTPAGIARALGSDGYACTGYTDIPSGFGLYGECRHGAETVEISTFDSMTDRDEVVRASNGLGELGAGPTGTQVLGDRFLITVQEPGDGQVVARIVDGGILERPT